MKKMKQPDVFGKIVEKVANDGWSGDACAVGVNEAATLLRRHHARVRRRVQALRDKGKVRTEYQSNREARCAVISAYTLACDDLLAALDAMAGKKGTR